jgi:hypothetical protein
MTMNEPFAGILAVEVARRSAGSARPDAPVIPEREPRPARLAATRVRMAGSLRLIARWVEPSRRTAKVCQPS